MSVSRLNNMAQRYDGGSEFTEVLISNYDFNERKNNSPQQMTLWSDEEGAYYE